MNLIERPREMQECSLKLRREGRRIGLVPTMGFLHEGHAALIRRARTLADWCVVSVFVNPTQFGPHEDFTAYPRDPQRDAELCRACGADALFRPAAADMYAADHSVYVDERDLSAGLCGAFRPGHFRGVLTVVAKLFNLVQPDVAVFGQKDAQQARLIQRLVRDLNFPVHVVIEPTVREPDGLALSSRNAYLNADERRRALSLSQALRRAEALVREGERDAERLKAAMRPILEAAAPTEIQYLEIVNYQTLRPTPQVAGPTLIAVAVKFGKTRLIDNVIVGR